VVLEEDELVIVAVPAAVVMVQLENLEPVAGVAEIDVDEP
jgi:hypothetical protein